MPHARTAMFLLALSLFAAGQPAPALAVDDAPAAYQRGLDAEQQRRWPEAEAAFSEALRLEPKHVEALLARARVYVATNQPQKALADLSEAIRLKPAEHQSYVDRAAAYGRLKQHDKAVADLTKAIELRPKDAAIRGARAVEYLLWGKYAEGGADLRQAIALNANDAGRDYQPNRKIELAPAALEHGRQQVERMLADRPPMVEHAAEAAFLRQWAARKFAGEDVGEPIEWEPARPTDSDAEHIAPTPGKRGRIMVDLYYQHGPKRGQTRIFEELWSRAVFELHNIALAKHFVRLHDEAHKGTIDKRQFVFQMWKYEETAMQLSRAFYLNHFLPLAQRRQIATDPELWFASHWQAIEESMLDSISRSAYPWRPYARQYDWQTFWALYKEGRVRRAMRLLEEMAHEEQHPQDLSEVYLWLGRCQYETGQIRQAVASLTECLRLNPNEVEALELRAEAYAELGMKEQSAADAARAKKLQKPSVP